MWTLDEFRELETKFKSGEITEVENDRRHEILHEIDDDYREDNYIYEVLDDEQLKQIEKNIKDDETMLRELREKVECNTVTNEEYEQYCDILSSRVAMEWTDLRNKIVFGKLSSEEECRYREMEKEELETYERFDQGFDDEIRCRELEEKFKNRTISAYEIHEYRYFLYYKGNESKIEEMADFEWEQEDEKDI